MERCVFQLMRGICVEKNWSILSKFSTSNSNRRNWRPYSPSKYRDYHRKYRRRKWTYKLVQELEDYYFIFVTDFAIHLFHMKHESTTSKGVLVGGQSENLNTLDHNGSMMVRIFENITLLELDTSSIPKQLSVLFPSSGKPRRVSTPF